MRTYGSFLFFTLKREYSWEQIIIWHRMENISEKNPQPDCIAGIVKLPYVNREKTAYTNQNQIGMKSVQNAESLRKKKLFPKVRQDVNWDLTRKSIKRRLASNPAHPLPGQFRKKNFLNCQNENE